MQRKIKLILGGFARVGVPLFYCYDHVDNTIILLNVFIIMLKWQIIDFPFVSCRQFCWLKSLFLSATSVVLNMNIHVSLRNKTSSQ